MNAYKPIPYAIFRQDDGLPVHYDPNGMQFTEVSDLHVDILERLLADEDPRDTEEARESFDELAEAGLITTEEVADASLTCREFQPNIVAFRVALTEKCNLNCAECFVTKNVDNLPTMRQDTLDDVIEAVLDYGVDRNVTIHFFGGEPLIRFDYIRLAVWRLNDAYLAGTIMKPRYSVTTNATLITEEMAEFFADNDFRVAVSIDGDEKLHDILRPDKGGTGSYASAKDGYITLSKAGVHPSIIVTPHPDYLDELLAAFEGIIADFQPDTITVNVPFEYETLRWSVDGRKYAELIMAITKVCRQNNIQLHSALSPILAALSNYAPRNSPCSMLCDDVMVSVRTDGKMSFCAQKWHEKMVQEIPRENRSVSVPLRLSAACQRCVARTICGGPCPACQVITGEELDRNKCGFMHSILGEIAKHLDWFEES